MPRERTRPIKSKIVLEHDVGGIVRADDGVHRAPADYILRGEVAAHRRERPNMLWRDDEVFAGHGASCAGCTQQDGIHRLGKRLWVTQGCQ